VNGLEQSLKSESVLHVGGRKALGLENLLRPDTVGFEDVTQENRYVSGLVSAFPREMWPGSHSSTLRGSLVLCSRV